MSKVNLKAISSSTLAEVKSKSRVTVVVDYCIFLLHFLFIRVFRLKDDASERNERFRAKHLVYVFSDLPRICEAGTKRLKSAIGVLRLYSAAGATGGCGRR